MDTHEYTRAARRRDEMVAEIQRRRDWGAWTPSDSAQLIYPNWPALPAWADPEGQHLIDLTERFAPRCEPEPPKLDREPESEFERRIQELLAEKAPEWVPFFEWGVILALWTFVVLAVCVILGQ
jgi:hypothetical protein